METNAIRISFCGDIRLLHPDRLAISSDILDIVNRCDINVINSEAPIFVEGQKEIEKSGPCITQSPEAPSWIEKNGWNVVSFANNHTMDFGTEGYYATRALFKRASVIGAGKWDEAYTPLIIRTKNGVKIGIIACSHREFGCLHDEHSQRDAIGYAWICHPKIGELISQTKDQVDFLFIYAHAGVEDLEQPLPEWRSLFKHFIDMGCDGVIASHPHVPMGFEMYRDRPIYYSLGNFCFQQEQYDDVSEQWFKSIMLELILHDDGTFSVENHLVIFNSEKMELQMDASMESENRLHEMNKCLSNHDEYMQYVNMKVLELLPWYLNLFKWSGLVPISLIGDVSIKAMIKNALLGRHSHREGHTPKTHLLNNLQCESHRWTIVRALKLRYGIIY